MYSGPGKDKFWEVGSLKVISSIIEFDKNCSLPYLSLFEYEMLPLKVGISEIGSYFCWN